MGTLFFWHLHGDRGQFINFHKMCERSVIGNRGRGHLLSWQQTTGPAWEWSLLASSAKHVKNFGVAWCRFQVLASVAVIRVICCPVFLFSLVAIVTTQIGRRELCDFFNTTLHVVTRTLKRITVGKASMFLIFEQKRPLVTIGRRGQGGLVGSNFSSH